MEKELEESKQPKDTKSKNSRGLNSFNRHH